MRRLSRLVPLAAAVALAGCLPGSGRQPDRSLAPSDSAAARIAATVPTDTLTLVWTAAAPESDPMPLPASLAWLGADAARLAVVETQEGSVRLFDGATGDYLARWPMAGERRFPYLAGTRGDTVVVLSRGADALDWITAAGTARSVDAPEGAMGALVTDSMIVVRTGGGPDGGPAALVRLDEAGRETARYPIAGSGWRAVGFVRAWGDSVLALSGYRPVVDVLTRRSRPGAPLDTLALEGFDNPQLVRSAQFLRGDAKEPPLLTSSAVALSGRLLVLNLRADRIRIDVYDPRGRLERILESPGTGQIESLYPVDLAVRRRGDDVEIAVLLQRPGGLLQKAASELLLYRWQPADDGA